MNSFVSRQLAEDLPITKGKKSRKYPLNWGYFFALKTGYFVGDRGQKLHLKRVNQDVDFFS